MTIEGVVPQKFVKSYQKSEVIFSENSLGEDMYIVYSGKVGLYAQAGPGHRKLLAVMKAGDFFGEMALVDDSPRSATAIAEEGDTKLLVLDKNKFTYLLRHQPDFALVVMGKLCRQLREANKALTKGK
ncbi:MAG: cyclic nucleotide-binding domain-containing protein [Chloroflexota bacterium]|nr:MAG: cyclic nucleotide-binding domain-containing protein [Chloroflexota bacterium]